MYVAAHLTPHRGTHAKTTAVQTLHSPLLQNRHLTYQRATAARHEPQMAEGRRLNIPTYALAGCS